MGEKDLEYTDGARFAEALKRGEAGVLPWLATRCDRVAARQFSAWAWRWMRDDFIADLASQLAGAVRGANFEIRGDAGAYVDTAIRNLCRRYFLDMARMRAHVPLDAASDQPACHGDSAAQVAAVIDLKRALDRLSPECRRMLQEKYLASRTLQEIGAGLGVEEKTARSRLHTCREKLRELWFAESTKTRPQAL